MNSESFEFYEKPSLKDIVHVGTKRHSGRYPWGSGGEPYQHSGDFLARINDLKKSGLKETEIAETMGFVNNFGKPQTTQLRIQAGAAKDFRRCLDVTRAESLQADGKSLNEIAKEMGYKNDSSVRSLLDRHSKERMLQSKNTADFLKKQVDKKGMIEVGLGVERDLNVSRVKLDQALFMLKQQGYELYGGGIPQVTNTGNQTNMQVLCKPGTAHKEIYDYSKVGSATDYITHDNGDTYEKRFVYPKSMDSKRLKVRYAEEGGLEKDGTIELRRNVPDLNLGGSHYSQVRILVDDTHYLKGMAFYSDHMPDGVDVIFNTNKSKTTPMLGQKDNTVLKTIKKDDPSNPFGSNIKEGGQSTYVDSNGKKQLSLINKRADESDWSAWKDKLPSQFLAKQNIKLIKKQLKISLDEKKAEYDEICSYTNPSVKKRLLRSFSDDCDAAAVHLAAAPLPGQKYHVILPVNSLKENEVYAPNYENGTKLSLIRFPHGGTFEIPTLTVNNKNQAAKRIIGNAGDALAINKKVADRLSGADFDGDTAMALPTDGKSRVHITSTPELPGLKGFDPSAAYPYHDGMKVMSNTQTEMGVISNLITDMTIKGANHDELARAVKHSMVVIDAEKHRLDYKQSYVDNRVAELKTLYQTHTDENGKVHHGGASTLLSKASADVHILKRKGSAKIDPATGEQTWKQVREEYVDKNGKPQVRTQHSTVMFETKNAHTLSSGDPKEEVYADYANALKALGNSARKEMVAVKTTRYDPSAKETYADEVKSLNAKLNVALKNAPRERQAQLIANGVVKALKQDNPNIKKEDVKKIATRELIKARLKVGAARKPVEITDREWEAIQLGAISPTKLGNILDNTDLDKIKERAMPRAHTQLSQAKLDRATAYDNMGYTNAQIASMLGVSVSTVSKYINKKGDN